MTLGDTMRGLISNEAGEALYDSSRNLTDKMTESQISSGKKIKSRSSNKSSNRNTTSKGRKGKKSQASIVYEEPSREDRGFAF